MGAGGALVESLLILTIIGGLEGVWILKLHCNTIDGISRLFAALLRVVILMG
jgi:hypothetical protein